MTYLVEKIDPRSERPDLTDESFEYNGPLAVIEAKRRWEDLTGEDHGAAAGTMQLLISTGEPYTWTDPETGVEVIARRA